MDSKNLSTILFRVLLVCFFVARHASDALLQNTSHSSRKTHHCFSTSSDPLLQYKVTNHRRYRHWPLLNLFPTLIDTVSKSHWRYYKSSKPFTTKKDLSVLVTSDTLPNFSTAHGLLSPEVVMRIADLDDLELNEPLDLFLNTYLKRGPMACVSMLSDPKILPELTKAMRTVAK